MSQQADELSVKRVARKIFTWYQEPTEEETVLDSIFAGYRATRFADYPSLFRGILHSETFASTRAALLRKWSPKFDRRGSVTLEEAQRFLKEWSSSMDHRLLFTRLVTVGSTHARRDNPSSDYHVSYYANRSAWTLHLIVRGAVDYHAGNVITAYRGDLVLISPDASCHYGRKPEIDQWLHYWAVFQLKPEWEELMQWPVCAQGMFKLSIEEEAGFLPFEKLFDQMLKLNEEDGPLSERLQANLLEQLLLRAGRYLAAEGFGALDVRVLKAMELMEGHLQAMTSVAEVANLCNLSESRLSHLFQQYLGMGVQKYRSNLRLQRAKKLLATTDEPIARVAEAVGYEDPVQFSKFFSRNSGHSPREFRASFASIL